MIGRAGVEVHRVHNILLNLCTILTIWSTDVAVSKGPPRVSLHSNPQKSYQVLAGGNIRLVCPVESDPAALLTWIKDGETIHHGWDRFRINEDEHVLRIKELDLEDSGLYLCRATNGFGTIELKYQLFVYDINQTLPSITEGYTNDVPPMDALSRDTEYTSNLLLIPPSPENVTTSVGGMASFVCYAQSGSMPRVQWMKEIDLENNSMERRKNQTQLVRLNNQAYVLLDNVQTVARRDGNFISKLTIENVVSEDGGHYICSVRSGQSFSYRSAYLTILPNFRGRKDFSMESGSYVPSPSDRLFPVIVSIIIISVVIFAMVIVIIVVKQRRQAKKQTIGTVSKSHQQAGFSTEVASRALLPAPAAAAATGRAPHPSQQQAPATRRQNELNRGREFLLPLPSPPSRFTLDCPGVPHGRDRRHQTRTPSNTVEEEYAEICSLLPSTSTLPSSGGGCMPAPPPSPSSTEAHYRPFHQHQKLHQQRYHPHLLQQQQPQHQQHQQQQMPQRCELLQPKTFLYEDSCLQIA